ncbi:MAG TPA: DUF4838 domain-containing protein [Kiritimatiellia bacterium]|nr:DUF4838 domain-containing protein [Kiritimatiellia bacterium]HOR97570.1 DUF4838 domain-containing protein [Kiritimatiellia bacterium]
MTRYRQSVFLFLLPFCVVAANTPTPDLVLARKGRPADRAIVCPVQASPSQRYAAEELQTFVEQMTGVRLPITDDRAPLPAKAILLGDTRHTAAVLGATPALDGLGTDGFLLKTVPPHLVIAGSPVRGTLYGVYELLERYGGCRWYTADYSVIPKRDTFAIPPLNDRQTPAFAIREDRWTDMIPGDVAARNRCNGHDMLLEERHGGKVRFGAGLVTHTFYSLMPPREFFAEHPEYYSLINGKRRAENAQLCLTNPDVLKITIARLIERIRKDPNAQIYSVSQEDNRAYCRCAACEAINQREGTPAGSLIAFLNQVAEAVEKVYPDVMIDTLAYQYTRTPPKTLKLRKNILIRLCTIEFDFSLPVNQSTKASNKRFIDEIRGWQALTDNLYIWDYVTNFGSYVGVYPNFGALQGNLRFYRDHGAVAIKQQGARPGKHADFAELKAWVIAKLLWNPDQPLEPLVTDFLEGYYGAAAPHVRAYLDATTRLVADPDIHIGCFNRPETYPWLTDDLLAKFADTFRQAEQAVRNDPPRLHHVRMLGLGVLYTQLRRIPLPAAPQIIWAADGARLNNIPSATEALAREVVARLDEEPGILLLQNSLTHHVIQAQYRALAGRVPHHTFSNDAITASLTELENAKLGWLAKTGDPAFNYLSPNRDWGVQIQPDQQERTAAELFGMVYRKAKTSQDAPRFALSRLGAISSERHLKTEGSRLLFSARFRNTRQTLQQETEPMIRAALNLGQHGRFCWRTAPDAPWRTQSELREPVVALSAAERGTGQIEIASPVTRRMLRLTFDPARAVSVTLRLHQAEAESVRVQITEKPETLAPGAERVCPLTLEIADPPPDLPGSLATAFVTPPVGQPPHIVWQGQPAARIVVPVRATPVERSAARELTLHLEAICGAAFETVTEDEPKTGPRLLVGNTDAARRLIPGFDPASLAYDGILLKTAGDDLILAGHPQRGPIYAVHTFLEDSVGVRWWTSDETFLPQHTSLPLPTLDLRYEPKLKFRETYYLDSFNARFKVRMKGNFSSRTRFMLDPLEMIPEAYGGNHRLIHFAGRNSAYHSFYELLPPAKYFKAHPEWYSEINGKRTHTRAQLCLTNEEMRRELTKNALALLRTDPGADFIQISQNDHAGRCTCARCLAVEKEEGGVGTASGPLLRFVNQVAEAIEKEFPNVWIDTFAYQYTRKAPTKTRPRRNVLVRLCDIECSFLHPIEGTPQNAKFLTDLVEWSRIAPGNLFLWDYVTSFSSYILPHPNLRVLAPNVRTFVKHGAIGLFEQGDALCRAGDFVRLRQWVLAHLLWNPDLDADALTDTFLAGYYGPRTGAALRRYLDFLHDRAARADVYLGCYQNNVTHWLDAEGILEALRLMDAALAEAKAEEQADPVGRKGLADKIRREKLPMDHVVILNRPLLQRHAKATGKPFPVTADPLAAVEAWIAACERFGVKAHRETTTADTFIDYKKSLLERARMASQKVSPPPCCATLPPASWHDVQEFEFDQRPAGQVAFVEDKAASNKMAAQMPGNHKIWAVQFPLTSFIPLSGTASGTPRCTLHVYARADATATEGNGLALGVYDFTARKTVAHQWIPLSELTGPGYKMFKFGPLPITEGCKFWANPPERTGEVQHVYVDRVVVVVE